MEALAQQKACQSKDVQYVQVIVQEAPTQPQWRAIVPHHVSAAAKPMHLLAGCIGFQKLKRELRSCVLPRRPSNGAQCSADINLRTSSFSQD